MAMKNLTELGLLKIIYLFYLDAVSVRPELTFNQPKSSQITTNEYSPVTVTTVAPSIFYNFSFYFIASTSSFLRVHFPPVDHISRARARLHLYLELY
jgi:hypothetical protein